MARKIRLRGKYSYLFSLVDDEIDAALMYDEKADELFGDFAYLNFGRMV